MKKIARQLTASISQPPTRLKHPGCDEGAPGAGQAGKEQRAGSSDLPARAAVHSCYSLAGMLGGQRAVEASASALAPCA
jgi:hypothetical protein